MIQKYLNEYNDEFDNSIKPISTFTNGRNLTLAYRSITISEVEEITKFCNMYNLYCTISNSHNEIFYTITNL